MVRGDNHKRSLELVEFELEQAIAQIKAGQPVIPVWLDTIYSKWSAWGIGTTLNGRGATVRPQQLRVAVSRQESPP